MLGQLVVSRVSSCPLTSDPLSNKNIIAIFLNYSIPLLLKGFLSSKMKQQMSQKLSNAPEFLAKSDKPNKYCQQVEALPSYSAQLQYSLEVLEIILSHSVITMTPIGFLTRQNR